MNRGKRILSAGLAAALAFHSAVPAQASPDVPPCDETLYITMDEYGTIRESSVVKGYTTNGNQTIVDYGSYGKITNMTDHSEPQVGEDGAVTFHLEKPASRFYFEGTVDVKADALPWKIDVGYRLNGVEKKAEALCGASGLVEVNISIKPNRGISDYYRNNMALMATTVVDMDKNLSLEAEGAQVQAMGNLKAVVFFLLPGEERDYSLRIGTDDFRFNGMVFTMVPLTVAQLDKVADLRDAKETVEDSADAISDSLDVVLDTLGNLQQSMRESADGLRMLNQTRQIFEDSKGQVYADADTALDSLLNFSGKLTPFAEDAKKARGMLQDLNRNINDLTDSLDELSPLLSDLREDIRSLQTDAERLRELLNSPAVDLGSQKILAQMEKTRADLDRLKTGQGQLTKGISTLAQAVPGLLSSTKALKKTAATSLYSKSELKDLAAEIRDEGLDDEDDVASYLFNEMDYSIDEIDALVDYLMPKLGLGDNVDSVQDTDTAEDVKKMGDTAQDGRLLTGEPATLSQLSPNSEKGNGSARSSGTYGTAAASLPPEMAGALGTALQEIVAGTQSTVGNTSLTEDISQLIAGTEQLLGALAAQRPAVSNSLKNAVDLAKTAEEICHAADDLISSVDDPTRTVNKHHTELIDTLTHAGEMTDSASDSLNALVVFCTSLENQLKYIGDPLNDGTKKTLEGLTGVLDRTGEGLSQTDILRNAKNTVKDLIDGKWDEYTAEDTTILNVDLDAKPISFTSGRNPSPSTVQVVLRTQEIKEDQAEVSEAVDESFHPDGNIFHRIANIFRRIWRAITGLFGK